MDTRQTAPLRAPESKPAPAPGRPPSPAHAGLRAPERKSENKAIEHLDEEFEVKFAEEGGEDLGVIEGYASKFDILDRGGDIMKPGAFKASIAEWKRKKAMPPILWNHDPYTPIGVWTEMKEDAVGLYVKGQLLLDIPQAVVVRSLVKAKAVRGLSIGYEWIDRDYDRVSGARLLKRVNLWEISPVTFPMLTEALIAGVKGDFDPKALERALRDEGLSNRDAKAAISVFRKHALRDAGSTEPAPRDGAAEMLTTLRKSIAALR